MEIQLPLQLTKNACVVRADLLRINEACTWLMGLIDSDGACPCMSYWEYLSEHIPDTSYMYAIIIMVTPSGPKPTGWCRGYAGNQPVGCYRDVT